MSLVGATRREKGGRAVSASGRRLPSLSRISLAVLIGASLLLAAHLSSSARSAAKSLPALRLDYNHSPRTRLEPIRASSLYPIALTNASLVRLLPSGKPVPDLARWKVSKNRLVYTFTIRSNARFSNGHPVTAGDAAFSIRRALSPSAKPTNGIFAFALVQGALEYFAGKTKTIPGVKVVDSRTLKITITQPAAYFLAELALPNTADVLDPAVVAGKSLTPGNEYLTNSCIGNQGAGPFKFVCRDRTSNPHSFYSGRTPMYTLVPNPYYGRKPRIRLALPAIPVSGDFLPDYKRYLAGTLDAATLPRAYIRRWKGKSSQYHTYSAQPIEYLTPNVHLPPFDNVHCRLAVAYALDRETLANKILGGTVRPSYAVLPKGMLGYYAGQNNPHYSPARARSELARCPGRTIPFELKYPALSSDLSNEFGAISTMLQTVGLNVKLTRISRDDWDTAVGQSLDRTHTQIIYDQWYQDYPDPQDYCTVLLRSDQYANIGNWSNRAYDRLVDRAGVILDRKVRAQLYIQAQHIALGQGAFISLNRHFTPRLIKPYVHGLTEGEVVTDLVPADDDWARVSIGKH